MFRTELDETAISDIRLTLAQSQPLGNNRFSEKLCGACDDPSHGTGGQRNRQTMTKALTGFRRD